MGYDDSQHPRGNPENAGQFRKKTHDSPSGQLTPTPGPLPGAFEVEILPEPHPDGGFDVHVVAPTGSRYLRDGVLHREDGPAYEGNDGMEAWYRDGRLHRDPVDGPAVVDPEEDFAEFYQDGRLLPSA